MLNKNTNSLLTILMAALISTHLGAIENQKSGQLQFDVRFEARNILYSPRENKKTLLGTSLRGLGYIFAGISPLCGEETSLSVPMFMLGAFISGAGCHIDLKKQSCDESAPLILNSAGCFFGAFTVGSMIKTLEQWQISDEASQKQSTNRRWNNNFFGLSLQLLRRTKDQNKNSQNALKAKDQAISWGVSSGFALLLSLGLFSEAKYFEREAEKNEAEKNKNS